MGESMPANSANVITVITRTTTTTVRSYMVNDECISSQRPSSHSGLTKTQLLQDVIKTKEDVAKFFYNTVKYNMINQPLTICFRKGMRGGMKKLLSMLHLSMNMERASLYPNYIRIQKLWNKKHLVLVYEIDVDREDNLYVFLLYKEKRSESSHYPLDRIIIVEGKDWWEIKDDEPNTFRRLFELLESAASWYTADQQENDWEDEG